MASSVTSLPRSVFLRNNPLRAAVFFLAVLTATLTLVSTGKLDLVTMLAGAPGKFSTKDSDGGAGMAPS